ncbi:hypothetical protein EVAR_23640_1 [Eumeta japonica]|uniref:Uncharacterized protein n=1 Tax=Eumeta variegata TaxID=151549 RepID=A0A4C1VHL3_EUMVA|nr:hypothetical protein EVAR_23640_1 [Eumeta japonica]
MRSQAERAEAVSCESNFAKTSFSKSGFKNPKPSTLALPMLVGRCQPPISSVHALTEPRTNEMLAPRASRRAHLA